MRKIMVCAYFIIFLFSNCSKEEWKGKIEYVGGVRVVKNFGEGVWEAGEKAKKAVFKEELSIGTSEGAESKIFH